MPKLIAALVFILYYAYAGKRAKKNFKRGPNPVLLVEDPWYETEQAVHNRLPIQTIPDVWIDFIRVHEM